MLGAHIHSCTLQPGYQAPVTKQKSMPTVCNQAYCLSVTNSAVTHDVIHNNCTVHWVWCDQNTSKEKFLSEQRNYVCKPRKLTRNFPYRKDRSRYDVTQSLCLPRLLSVSCIFRGNRRSLLVTSHVTVFAASLWSCARKYVTIFLPGGLTRFLGNSYCKYYIC